MDFKNDTIGKEIADRLCYGEPVDPVALDNSLIMKIAAMGDRIHQLETALREIADLPKKQEDWFSDVLTEREKAERLAYAMGRIQGQTEAAAIANKGLEGS